MFLQTFPRAPGRPAHYDIAIASSGITLFVCLFLNQAFGGKLSLTPFVIPVVLSAWAIGHNAQLAGERVFSHGATLSLFNNESIPNTEMTFLQPTLRAAG
jgi:hypothetical protein